MSPRRWLRVLGLGWLALFGIVWVSVWLVLALAASETGSDQSFPWGYLLLVIGGPLGGGVCAYRVARRSGSRLVSTSVALAIFAVSVVLPPIAFFLVVALS
jgi:hypothetical protein